MPTGYTAPVQDGSITDLRSFALLCARGMGACVMQREEPMDVPPKREIEPSSYHAEKIKEGEAEIARLKGMTDEEADIAAAQEATELAERNRDYAKKFAEQKARYEAMIVKVEAWEGSPQGVKEFALSQLRESLSFDCGGTPFQQPSEHTINGACWRARKLEAVYRDLSRDERENAKEIERAASRQAWIDQLYDSLPAEEEQKHD